MEKVKLFFSKYGHIFRTVALIAARVLPSAVILIITVSSMMSARTSANGITPLDTILFSVSYLMALFSLFLAFRVKISLLR